ncbi:MAG: diaminopimelate decarboxylase [Phycisphaerae bacterium]|nr:diaminopimelate decarboxylase [Phycisphaerae bacterium]
MDAFTYIDGRLLCEGVPASALADRFGTPLYVYSRATLEGHFDRLSSAFAALGPLVCFSVKSCSNLHVLRVLVTRGAGLDVVSGGELARARRAGCPDGRIVFAGVGKSRDEIAAAMDPPIGWFNAESEQELDAIAEVAGRRATGEDRRPRVALRVNPQVAPDVHAYTATGVKGAKFGVDFDEARRLFDRFGTGARAPITLDGLHLHIGSPIYETGPYVEAIRGTLALVHDLAARGHAVRSLNIGGGFGADYQSARSPSARDYAEAIVPLLRERVGAGLRVLLEPGRTIAANAGILLTRVRYTKTVPGPAGPKRIVIADAGMQTLIRPSLYGAFHFVWPTDPGVALVPARRAEDPGLPGLARADLVGPICESGDFLAKDRPLPPLAPGDLVAVFTAGAYGMSMASNYNSHPLPAEVLVEGADARLIRRRQTIDDMLAAEERG